MKPWNHAKGSAVRYGGKAEEYLPLHDFFDSTKAAMPDVRHRAVLHNAMGIFLLEKVFGPTFTNSEGKVIPTRDIGENHVMEDMGFIPSLEDWLEDLPQKSWHGGIHRLQKNKRPSSVNPKDAIKNILLDNSIEPNDELIEKLYKAAKGI